MLSDEQLIAEIRDVLIAETRGIEPRAGLLDRVYSGLEAPSDVRRASWRSWRPTLGGLSAAVAATVAVAVAAIALLLLGHRSNFDTQPSAGTVAVGTVQIAAQTPDPTAGLPWALRTIQTGEHRACLQIGRLRVGQVGVVGQDGAYHNDHQFHQISIQNNFPCGTTDAHGYQFLNVVEQDVPASAALGKLSGCRVGGGVPKLAVCPRADLRDVAYGVLGPQAVSISYTLHHQTITRRTGPDGAYIVVLPGTSELCATDAHGGRGCTQGAGETTTSTIQSGVISAVTYRDGHVCHLSAASASQASCPNIGYTKYPPLPQRHITTAQVRSTVTPSFAVTTRVCYRPTKGVRTSPTVPCAHRIPSGYKVGYTQPTLLINMRFVAPLAADNHHSVYEWSVGRVSGPACSVGGGGVSATTMTPINAGQLVILQDNEPPCPGTYKGVITYQPDGAPGRDTLIWNTPIHDHSVLVNRFTIAVPKTH